MPISEVCLPHGDGLGSAAAQVSSLSASEGFPPDQLELLTDASAPPPPVRIRALRTLSDRVIIPLAAIVAVALLADSPVRSSILTALAFFCAALVLPSRGPWSALLRLTRSPQHAVRPLLGVGILAVIHALTGYPLLGGLEFIALLGLTAAAGMLPHVVAPHFWGAHRQIRTAVIGSDRSARDLARELSLARIGGYTVVGRVEVSADHRPKVPSEIPALGTLDQLSTLVERHRIDLLVMTGEAPRFKVFERIASSCLHLPVRLWELSGFYEEVFGHVPVAEINSAWFQYIIHPKYRPGGSTSKRALDVLVATILGVVFLPILMIVAVLIRRDGGPVLFKQVRIGEGGRPIEIYKLRTMREGPDQLRAQWAALDDPRVTRVGRFLRRTHLDELPQLVNVLRGEMSLVGPRPEQPEFVARLEQALPFYARRHLLKPGITGWAQVRCGYAGSDVASAWKLSHDLYYLKHRSLGFDLALLGETIRTLVANQQYALKRSTASFIHRESTQVE
jgi:exopolysaccharide biosynthesis polyprenyl glycosylphosphotransferase